MNEERIGSLLLDHADALVSGSVNHLADGIGEGARQAVDPLLRTAQSVYQTLRPVRPSPAFVRSLARELSRTAEKRLKRSTRVRRTLVIVAAVVGSVLSAASLLAGLIILIGRIRSRAHDRAPRAVAG